MHIWKTIRLGTGLKTAEDFRDAFKEAGYEVEYTANYLLDHKMFPVSEVETEVDLVVVSLAESFFVGEATHEDVYRKAQSLGLSLCPAEVGPQLRLQYADQPKSELLLIAMEPLITEAGSEPRIFSVEHYDGIRFFSSRGGHPQKVRNNLFRWVFLHRR